VRAPRALVSLIALLLVGGCGGGDEDGFAFEPTRECLAGLGTVNDDRESLEAVAPGTVGAAEVDLGDNIVLVLVGETPEDAERIAGTFQAFGGATGAAEDVLEQRENVVLFWAESPSDDDAGAVRDCLRG
jgi:hypothetical protein